MKINRDELIRRLHALENTPSRRLVKILTGIKSCGKSSLLEVFGDSLRLRGVPSERILRLDFEAQRYDPICDEDELYNFIAGRIVPGEKTYLLFSEPRFAGGIGRIIDSFYVYDNVDIYVSTSSAYFMEEDLRGLLFARFIQIPVLPLSLEEYETAWEKAEVSKTPETPAAPDAWTAFENPEDQEDSSAEDPFHRYLQEGGLPCIARQRLSGRGPGGWMADYLQGLYSTILVQSIIPHRQISDTGILEYLLHFIAQHIGQLLSPKKISDLLRGAGRPTNIRTVDSYLDAFAANYIVFRVGRYDIKTGSFPRTLEKYYLADLSLRSLLFGMDNRPAEAESSTENAAGNDTPAAEAEDPEGGARLPARALLENLIFLELLRRGCQVYLGKFGKHQVSFAAFEGQLETAPVPGAQGDGARKEPSVTPNTKRIYIQIVDNIDDDAALKPALRTLARIPDNYPKYIISMSKEQRNFNGIEHIPAEKFLRESGKGRII